MQRDPVLDPKTVGPYRSVATAHVAAVLYRFQNHHQNEDANHRRPRRNAAGR